MSGNGHTGLDSGVTENVVTASMISAFHAQAVANDEHVNDLPIVRFGTHRIDEFCMIGHSLIVSQAILS